MTLELNKAMVEMYKQRMKNKRPKVETLIETNNDYIPKSKFEELYGCDNIRQRLLQVMAKFSGSLCGKAEKFPWPILISGSSGLGKTSIVEATANHSNSKLNRFPLKVEAKKIKNEFQIRLKQFSNECIKHQPSIILFDDLDQLNGKEDLIDLLILTLHRLLDEELDFLIICTTSKLLDEHWDLKFLLTIELKRPDLETRFKILESLSKKYINFNSLNSDDMRTIAINSPSFTPEDFRQMIHLAECESYSNPVTLQDCINAVEIIKLSFKQGTHLIAEKPNTTWDDIGGMSEVRKEFVRILNEIKTGDVDCQFTGVLLYGPPGCGKTMVAKAMANEAGLNFICINPTELQNKFFGETERNIRKVFKEAREYEPCVIYFDEFDGLCGTRGSKDNMTSAIQTLLSEMDGFRSRGKSIILASTNRLEDIDVAILRPGRFTKHILVSPPDEKARRDILRMNLSKYKLKLSDDTNLDNWAKRTRNLTGAELAFLVREIKQEFVEHTGDNLEINIIKQQHFESALKKIKSRNIAREDTLNIAY